MANLTNIITNFERMLAEKKNEVDMLRFEIAGYKEQIRRLEREVARTRTVRLPLIRMRDLRA